MKKLGRLNINIEKLISDEELQKLRGGWLGDCAIFIDGDYYDTWEWICYVQYAWQCDQDCAEGHSYLGSNVTCFCNWPY